MRALAATMLVLSACDFDAAYDAYCANGHVGCPNRCPADGGLCLLASVPSVAFLSVHNGYVYWSTKQHGTLMETATSGEGEPTVLGDSLSFPSGVFATDHDVYWTSELTHTGSIHRYSLDDRTQTVVKMDLNGPCDVAATATDLYFSENQLDAGPGLFRMPLGGTTPVRIGPPTTSTCDITLTPDSVYWTDAVDFAEGSVWRANLDGSNARTVATLQFLPFKVAADDKNIYWTNHDLAGEVSYVPLSGGQPTSLADMLNQPAGIVTDGEWVYWAEDDVLFGAVKKARVGGGPPITLVANQIHPLRVAVDDQYVYWGTFAEDGGVYRIAK